VKEESLLVSLALAHGLRDDPLWNWQLYFVAVRSGCFLRAELDRAAVKCASRLLW